MTALGSSEAPEELIANPVEEADVGEPDEGAQHAERRIEGELGGGGRGVSGDMEDDFGAVVKGVDHKGDDGREDTGNDGLEFEVLLPIEDFRSEKCAAERGLEDSADPSGRPGKEHGAPLPVAHFQSRGEDGAEARAYLGDRPFLSRRSTRSDRDGGGDGLDHRHPFPDDALLPVEAVDHGVRPVPLSLGGKGEDQQTGDEPAKGGYPEHHPSGERDV